MNFNSNLVNEIMRRSQGHTHVNAIDIFAKTAATAFHNMPLDPVIDNYIKDLEGVIQVLKDIKNIGGIKS
jgi:hypothetical protein